MKRPINKADKVEYISISELIEKLQLEHIKVEESKISEVYNPNFNNLRAFFTTSTVNE